MNAEELTEFVNSRHGASFRVVAPLAGGYQEGAWKIAEMAGRIAVLKPTRAAAVRSLRVVRRLRRAGYPAPEILFAGAAPDGTDYQVQEWVRGTSLETLTPEYAQQLIALNRLQSGLMPDPEPDEGNWSEYAYNVVFADESGWASCLRDYSPETARLREQITHAAAPYADISLPAGDAVHGDWSVGNLLAENGEITGIVDCASAGHGTRAVDLASLLHYAYADQYDSESGKRIRGVLRDEILSVGGMPLLVVLLLYRAMALVEFAIRFHGAAGVAAFAAVADKIIGEIETAEGNLSYP